MSRKSNRELPDEKVNDDPEDRTLEEEVADRTGDKNKDDAEVTDVTFRKGYVVGLPKYVGKDAFNPDELDHGANKQNLVNEAINNGLRVVGDVEYVGCEWSDDVSAPNNETLTLWYEAPAKPAHLLGTGPLPEMSDQAGTMDEVVSPSDMGTTGNEA